MNDHMDDAMRPNHDDLQADIATGDAPRDDANGLGAISEHEKIAAAIHAGVAPPRSLPSDLASRMIAEGEGIVSARSGAVAGRIAPARRGPALAFAGALAAGLVVATVAAVMFAQRASVSEQQIAVAEEQLAELQARITTNNEIVQTARAQVAALEGQLAAVGARELRLAERLADATNDLELAMLEIAKYEQPVDPAILAANRRKLLEVPDTVRLAWAPFDLPDAPAEQQQVTGDVVWNDELQQGFLRFVGLEPNDPNIEQYQVWVIDERGMEQKVSGGVFNATAQGEVIVPIEPGIDVGRVALFAITIEEPGGTWVPDLRRRVVVAPRDS